MYMIARSPRSSLIKEDHSTNKDVNSDINQSGIGTYINIDMYISHVFYVLKYERLYIHSRGL